MLNGEITAAELATDDEELYFDEKTKENIYKVLDKALRIYNTGNFQIGTIECDNEFKSIMDAVSDNLDIQMNYSNAQEHVGAA